MIVEDPITGEVRLITPGRSKRPGSTGVTGARKPSNCPFCPGEEAATPPEIARIPDSPASWQARVFDNLYPLASTHEVLVNCARHATSVRQLSISELQFMVSMWQARSLATDILDDEYVHLFVNDGLQAGASLPHSHAQLLRLPMLPGSEALFRRCISASNCSICSLIHGRDYGGGSLHGYKFMEVEGFVGCVSPAPRRAGAVILAPAEHHTDFPGFDSALLAAALFQLFAVTEDQPMNLWVVQNRSSEAHWYIEMVPRIGRSAGVELGLGLDVCIQDPLEHVNLLKRQDPPAIQ